MRAWVLTGLIAASAGVAARVQHADDLTAYRQLVDDYRSGTISATDANTNPDTNAATQADARADWTADDLNAAAMLHTDAGLRLMKADRRADARAELEAAANLLHAAVDRDAADREYAIRWREAVAGLLHAAGANDVENDLQTRGREWWPPSKEEDVARAAFADGLANEIRAAVAGRLSGPPATHAVEIPPDAVSALRNALEQYDVAMRHDVGDAEAALHFGRVSLVLARDADAAPHLLAAARAHSRSVRYLAAMFLGAAAERAGRMDEAIDRYREAQDLYRSGQSAPLALSHALMRAGRDEDARGVLMDRFTARDSRAFDPLWTYLADPSTDLGPTLDELRAEVWR